MDLSRRELMKLGGTAFAGAALVPSAAHAQTPKRGGR
ncbi:MAG: twin-arginine translocation signal domain-containing protein [Candidatus Rokuibacteriota bacterium]